MNHGAKYFSNAADNFVAALIKEGVKAYIWHKATTGSVYVRFEDSRMGSVRIGNHDGREHLKYKFNLRDDISPKQKGWRKDGGVWRHYCPLNQWKELVPMLVERQKQVAGWPESKYNYIVPKFKQ